MADLKGIREGMQVLGSDGGMVGEVAGVHGDHIHLRPTPPVEGGADRTVPKTWVAHVDQHVHLNREAALVRDTWGSGEGHVIPPSRRAAAPAAREPAHSGVGKSWFLWLLGALLLAAIIFLGIRGCGYAATDPNYEDNAKGEISEADRAASGAAAAGGATAGALAGQVESYFRSSDAAPRTFTFENLRFDTGSAEIRSENRQELAELGRMLAAQPNGRFRVVGYADPRGDTASNQDLGKRRAEAVAAALVANGVPAGSIETASGGETADAQSLAEDRRTELVILSR